jgi:uncharacterized membrane protein
VSERRLRLIAAALALAGIAVATYLTWVHYEGIKPFCVAGGGGCERVQTSDYADLAGAPVALIGLIGYVTILASLLIPRDLGRFAGAFLGLVGFGFSIYLTYLELFVIHAICQWCVASALLMTLLMTVLVVRAARGPDVAVRLAQPEALSAGH